jgi:dextranase
MPQKLNRVILLTLFIMIFHVDAYANIFGEIHTNRANYLPGTTIQFRVEINELPLNNLIKVEYYYLNQLVDSTSYSSIELGNLEWNWEVPDSDFCGYLVRLSAISNQLVENHTTIAVDVSSDWSRFPRYGFLSNFSLLSQSSVDATVKDLNRFHINGIQYYDWHYKHHMPLKGDPSNPAGAWSDIANRTNYLATIKRYIDAGHEHGMKSMAYNLLYGAYENAESDGVATQWRLFRDEFHSNPDFHDLPDSWASDIYLIDPSNAAWKNYLLTKMSDVFQALLFDGWHLDQLGDRGNRYNYGGQRVYINQTFLPFLEESKLSLNVPLVMNAVNQYGQSGIAQSPVEFLYTEVWGPNENYSDLVSIILNNNTYSENKLSTVLAAYVNRSLSSQPGYFNTPSVLLTDAVIFAAGGSHLELGEHMLANEYFPNNNLKMSSELKNKLIHYYDFLVFYQNLLRDGGVFNQVYLKSQNNVSIKTYSQIGSIWNFSKLKGNLQIFHLINFTGANSLNWRDDFGKQTEPDTLNNIPVYFNSIKKVNTLWLASPDYNDGCPQNILFSQINDTVFFEIPHLKYWNMVVADFSNITSIDNINLDQPNVIEIKGNYPNPFNPETKIKFQIHKSNQVRIEIYNLLGQRIAVLADKQYNGGTHEITWKPIDTVPSGFYICNMIVNGRGVDQIKLLYLK